MNKNGENQFGFFRDRGLPDPQLKPLWQNIILANNTKRKLLNYSLIVQKLDAEIKRDLAIYSFALLYGKPGTGKTSIALGCANEVAERVFDRSGKRIKLLEMDVGSLFSEYLGRSVQGILDSFASVRLAARHGPVIIILDEIESIAVERSSLSSGDPSEVMRVVNAFLTEIDRLRYCNGVLIFATSNLKFSIDAAVWDRSDLKVHIGIPCKESAMIIIERSFRRLASLGITVEPSFYKAFVDRFYNNGAANGSFSGRELSRLPLIAVCSAGRLNLTRQDGMNAAESLVNKNGKEHNHGNFKKENDCWS